jgi:ABC-2 type transport system permease protein
MKKHLRLFVHFIKLSWMAGMEYRANFFLWMLVDVGWTAMDFIFFTVLVSYTQAIGRWGFGEAIVVAGFFRLMVVPVWGWMYQCFRLIPRLISEGKLDLLLTKPIDSQFLVSSREFSFSVIPSIVGGLGFMIYGFGILERFPLWNELILFAWLIFVAIVLMYGMYFTTVALSLYFDRLDNIHHLFTSMYDASRYPREIYSMVLQRILTFAIPVALMLAVPVDVLFGRIEWNWIIWFQILAIGFFVLSKWIWNHGLRRYTSASS